MEDKTLSLTIKERIENFQLTEETLAYEMEDAKNMIGNLKFAQSIARCLEAIETGATLEVRINAYPLDAFKPKEELAFYDFDSTSRTLVRTFLRDKVDKILEQVGNPNKGQPT
jgi:hypothetical protein